MENNLLKFKVSSHLKNIIGKDLITDKYVAIFELVKNSVDAKAKNIDVIIRKDKIIIKDDGIGMTLEDIENKWLFIGYSEKKDSKEMFAGSKGIGRFSADNLAEHLELVTKNKNGQKITIDIDWNLFEGNQNEKISDINIPYEVTQDNAFNGTSLILTRLRKSWDKEDIERLKRSLEKIENPFNQRKEVKINLQTEFADCNGIIENNLLELLNEKCIYLNLNVKNSIFSGKLIHNNKKIVEFSYVQETCLECMDVNLYHLTQGAKKIFTTKMGIVFTNYGNIFVYRNGFRIYPYGEIDYDIFGLNIRKSQGYNRYLGTRDLIGSISIKDTKNNFVEVSSRDNGFIKNFAYLELEEIYMEYHRFLEDFMKITLFNTTMNYDINEKIVNRFRKKANFEYKLGENNKVIEYSDVINKIEKDIPLSNAEKKVIKDNNTKFKMDLKESKSIKKENKSIKKQNEKLQKEISIKNKILDDNINPSSVYVEMFNHHINTEVNELKGIIEDYKEKDQELLNNSNFIEFEKKYYEIIYKLYALKNSIFNFKEKRIGRQKEDIVQFIEEYSYNWSQKNSFKNIRVFTNNISFVKICDIMDFVIVLDNLYENANKANAVRLDVTIELVNEELVINFISKGGNLVGLDISKVFDFGYSTKRRGTGMGMFFVKKILVQRYNAEVLAKIINNDFITIIKMR